MMTVVGVMAHRAARAGLLVTTAGAATASGRHARTCAVAGGQRAFTHQRAGETLSLPVPGHDQENGHRQ